MNIMTPNSRMQSIATDGYDNKISLAKQQKQLANKAINFYKKICSKTFSTPNNHIISNLKHDNLHIFLDNFSVKESPPISRVIGSFSYFKNMIIATSDPNSK